MPHPCPGPPPLPALPPQKHLSLEGCGLCVAPPSLCALPRLAHLDLTCNALAWLPPGPYLAALETLILSANRFVPVGWGRAGGGAGGGGGGARAGGGIWGWEAWRPGPCMGSAGAPGRPTATQRRAVVGLSDVRGREGS